MRIDVLCNDGSPLGVTCKSIYGEDGRLGVGGAELALLTLCEAWHNAGHQVVLYNNPRIPNGSPFTQCYINQFNPRHDRDVLVVFRSPNRLARGAKGLRVWLSCDQQTTGDFAEFARAVDKVVTISDFHTSFLERAYGIGGAIAIDLPIRVWEYQEPIPKIPKRCIFTSVPDRGLHLLRPLWDKILLTQPDASLVITSDYRLWGTDEPLNEQHRVRWTNSKNVIFRGGINRRELVKEQLQAQIHLYPCIYDELMCLSVAESMVAGAYPITSDCGALRTTNMGGLLPGSPGDPTWMNKFIRMVSHHLEDPELPHYQENVKARAIARFRPERIIEQWNEKVFKEG